MIGPIIKNNDNTTSMINYLKNMQTQYKVLTKDEEYALIQKYKNDRPKLNHLLFMHNIKIVFNTAKKYMSKTNDFDGMIQDGMVGLAEACRRFDVDKDIKFITYATWWVRKYILLYFYSQQHNIDQASVSLQAVLQNVDTDGKDVTFESYINEYIDKSYDSSKTIDNELTSIDQTDICNTLMDKLNNDSDLSATDKDIFYKLFYNREKPKHLASEYNLSVGYINNLKTKVLNKFKNILINDYNINSYQDILIG